MNRIEIFNYLFDTWNEQNIEYVILHSYQNLPDRFDSDIDTAVNTPGIKKAIALLDHTLKGTDWKIIQYWRHENYAADCVISNDREFLQVDLCTHYERNGRVVISVEELLKDRQLHKNFYVPSHKAEFIYVLIKKVMKQSFSDTSKNQLTTLWQQMSVKEKEKTKYALKRFFSEKNTEKLLAGIAMGTYDQIILSPINQELKHKTFRVKAALQYLFFDFKRKIERLFHPTGLFIVLLGVDGTGKTTIAKELGKKYVTAFRRIKHYHSRVRVLKDLSQIKNDSDPTNTSDPHGKKKRSGRVLSIIKFAYYFLDFLIGNIIIFIAKRKSTLVIIERYYYDYTIDKIRYNLNLSDSFIRFFGHFISKPNAIFVLTGDSQILLERKHELTIEEINLQKKCLQKYFEKNANVTFIDTTKRSVEECIEQILVVCNQIMREQRKWE